MAKAVVSVSLSQGRSRGQAAAAPRARSPNLAALPSSAARRGTSERRNSMGSPAFLSSPSRPLHRAGGRRGPVRACVVVTAACARTLEYQR